MYAGVFSPVYLRRLVPGRKAGLGLKGQVSLMVHSLAWTLGPWEVVIILVIALLLFGKRLPEVGKSLGKGLVEFKKGLRGVEEDIERSTSEYEYRSTQEAKKIDREPTPPPTGTASATPQAKVTENEQA